MNKTLNYQSPVAESLNIEVEGVICASGGDGSLNIPIYSPADPGDDVL